MENNYETEEIEIENEDTDIKIEQPGDDGNQNIKEPRSFDTAAQQNKSIRLEWYKISNNFIPEKYKLQYVHANAEARNEKIILDWYTECEIIGLIPEELKLIPEEQKENNEKQKKNHFTRKEKKNGKREKQQKQSLKSRKKKNTKTRNNISLGRLKQNHHH